MYLIKMVNWQCRQLACKFIQNCLDFLNLYNPCLNISCNEYDFYLKQLDTIIAGDINYHLRMWDIGGPNNGGGVNLVDAFILHPSITLLSPT